MLGRQRQLNNFAGFNVRPGRVLAARGPQPLQLAVTRNNVRGMAQDHITANRPLTVAEIHSFVTQLAGRFLNGNRRTWITFRFDGINNDVYRSVRSSNIRTIAQLERRLREFSDPANHGSGGVGFDENAEPYVLNTSSFDFIYPPNARPVDFFANDTEGFGKPPGSFTETLVATLSGLEEFPNAAHCFDRVCSWFGIPFYSHTHGALPPTQKEGEDYLSAQLISIHGVDSPASKLYWIDPWQVLLSQADLNTLFIDLEHQTIATIKAEHDGVVHRGEFYATLRPQHVWFLSDPDKMYAPHGPRLLARANNHLEVAMTFYSETTKCWHPQLNRTGQYFFYNGFLELWRLVPVARHTHEFNELLPAEGTNVQPNWVTVLPEGITEDMTIDDILIEGDERKEKAKKYSNRITLLDKRFKLVKVISQSELAVRPVLGKRLWVGYDYETIYDTQAKLSPYAVAWLEKTDQELADMDLTFPPSPETTEELMKQVRLETSTFCGVTFANRLKEIMLAGLYETIILIGFNAAKFDAFLFLADSSLLEDLDGKFRPHMYWTNHFLQQGALASGTLRVRDAAGGLIATKLTLFDLAKHLTGTSLKKAAEDFNTPHRKQEGFSHAEVQEWYEKDGSGFIHMREGFLASLETYNKLDVIVLMELLESYRRQLYKVTSIVTPTSSIPLTAGSLCLKHWTKDVEERIHPGDFVKWAPFPGEPSRPNSVMNLWEPLDEEAWMNLRTGVVGGRCEIPNGPTQVPTQISSLDVCSMYPYVMAIAPVWYPCGNWHKIPGPPFTRSIHYLGIYKICIDHSDLEDHNKLFIVPRKEYSPSGALLKNNWNATIIDEVWVTTPTMQLIEELNVKHRILGGYEWDSRIRSCDLFGALLDFMVGKRHQDSLPPDSPEKNKALRTLYKLLMNATYGQTLKGLFERTVTSVSEAELEKLYLKEENGTIESINVLRTMHGKIFVDYTRSTASRLDRQGPFVVGAFVLGYSRTYLYRNLLQPSFRHEILVIDTDSAKMTVGHKRYLRNLHRYNLVPHWPDVEKQFPGYLNQPLIGGKEVGCFTEELPENDGIIVLFKKGYLVYDHCRKPVSISLKGVRRSDIVISALEVAALKKASFEDRSKWAREQFAKEDRIISEDPYPLFFQTLRTGNGFVLSSVIQRISWNSKRNVRVGDEDKYEMRFGHLMQNFRVKKIGIPEDVFEDLNFDPDFDPPPIPDPTKERYLARINGGGNPDLNENDEEPEEAAVPENIFDWQDIFYNFSNGESYESDGGGDESDGYFSPDFT